MSPFWREGLPVRLEVEGANPPAVCETNPPVVSGANPSSPASVEGTGAHPQRFYWRWRWHRVDGVLHHWRVHTNWWTDREIWRDYWEVTTDTGLLCSLYCDLVDGEWYLEHVVE